MVKTHEDRIAIVENENKQLKDKNQYLEKRLDFITKILIENGLLSDSDECSVKECAKKSKLHEQTIYKLLKKPQFADTFKQQGKKKIVSYSRFISVLQDQA